MARLTITFCLSFLMSLLLVGTMARAAELEVSIEAQQLQGEERAQDACYKAAESMKKDSENFRVESDTLPKKNEHDQDAILDIYSSQVSTCVLLRNHGANDYAWGLGAFRLRGCSCNLSMKIR